MGGRALFPGGCLYAPAAAAPPPPPQRRLRCRRRRVLRFEWRLTQRGCRLQSPLVLLFQRRPRWSAAHVCQTWVTTCSLIRDCWNISQHTPPGFLAGLLAASQGSVPPPQPPLWAAAATEGGTGASAPEPTRPPFLALLEDFPDLFKEEVLERLDHLDLALLGRTGSVIRTAVKTSGVPRIGGGGPRVGIAYFFQPLPRFLWAVANGCPWQLANICETLAGGGHLEVLRWAWEHDAPWDKWTCTSAALGGHLEVLLWARERDCPWDKSTCEYAAMNGHFEVLKWAREHGCEWDQDTCSFAAMGNYLELLQWAREHHCPWDEHTCELRR